MTEILIALGIFTLLTAAMISFMLNVQSQIQGEKTKSAVYLARNIITRFLKSPSAWDVTVAKQKSSAFACFDNPQASCMGRDQQGYTPFALYDDSGEPIVASSNANPGFNYRGVSCQGADLNNGNDACPIAVQLKWKRICPSASCENPIAHVVADFFNRPKSRSRQVPLNTKALGVSMDIPKLRQARIANEVVGYYYKDPKEYSNRTSADTRAWQNPCSIHTKTTSGPVSIPAASTMVANGSTWVLQWGGSNYAALLPDHIIPISVELEMYIDNDPLPCASDSGYIPIDKTRSYTDPGATDGAELSVTCTRYFPSPGQHQLRLVARVTSCVMNPAINNDPDFRIMGLEYTLLR